MAFKLPYLPLVGDDFGDRAMNPYTGRPDVDPDPYGSNPTTGSLKGVDPNWERREILNRQFPPIDETVREAHILNELKALAHNRGSEIKLDPKIARLLQGGSAMDNLTEEERIREYSKKQLQNYKQGEWGGRQPSKTYIDEQGVERPVLETENRYQPDKVGPAPQTDIPQLRGPRQYTKDERSQMVGGKRRDPNYYGESVDLNIGQAVADLFEGNPDYWGAGNQGTMRRMVGGVPAHLQHLHHQEGYMMPDPNYRPSAGVQEDISRRAGVKKSSLGETIAQPAVSPSTEMQQHIQANHNLEGTSVDLNQPAGKQITRAGSGATPEYIDDPFLGRIYLNQGTAPTGVPAGTQTTGQTTGAPVADPTTTQEDPMLFDRPMSEHIKTEEALRKEREAGVVPGQLFDFGKYDQQRQKKLELFKAGLVRQPKDYIQQTFEKYYGKPVEGVRPRESWTYDRFTGKNQSEVSITVEDSRINSGKPTNIPSLYNGEIVSREEAIQRVVDAGGKDPETGRILPGFEDRIEARNAAKQRSDSIDRMFQELPELPRHHRPEYKGKLATFMELINDPNFRRFAGTGIITAFGGSDRALDMQEYNRLQDVATTFGLEQQKLKDEREDRERQAQVEIAKLTQQQEQFETGLIGEALQFGYDNALKPSEVFEVGVSLGLSDEKSRYAARVHESVLESQFIGVPREDLFPENYKFEGYGTGTGNDIVYMTDKDYIAHRKAKQELELKKSEHDLLMHNKEMGRAVSHIKTAIRRGAFGELSFESYLPMKDGEGNPIIQNETRRDWFQHADWGVALETAEREEKDRDIINKHKVAQTMYQQAQAYESRIAAMKEELNITGDGPFSDMGDTAYSNLVATAVLRDDINGIRNVLEEITETKDVTSVEGLAKLGQFVGPVEQGLREASAGWVPIFGEWMSKEWFDSPEGRLLGASLSSLHNKILKLRSGAAVTTQEFRRAMTELPSRMDDPELFMRKLAAVEATLEGQFKLMVRHENKSIRGKKVDGDMAWEIMSQDMASTNRRIRGGNAGYRASTYNPSNVTLNKNNVALNRGSQKPALSPRVSGLLQTSGVK